MINANSFRKGHHWLGPLRLALLLSCCFGLASAWAEAPIEILFLGDQGHHQPAARAAELIPALEKVGIAVTYTDQLDDLNATTLGQYDGLILYANHEHISPAQEKALLDFVNQGGGFVPLHCASYCFHNSPAVLALVGGQFAHHGTGEFVADIVDRDHPITAGTLEFRTWDETYVHTKLSSDRQVLMTRSDDEGAEPWTWVREQGKGRVFYTAYGHDSRTFTHPGFHRLVERGIRWATRRPIPMAEKAPFAYQEAKIAFYPPADAPGIRQDSPTQMQLPLPPAESMKHMALHPDFEARLFASEPDIVKVIAMNWDARGRLWAAETVDYPNDLKTATRGQDRIRICEDTDGDGRADKFTIFADQLSIPTSLVFARGGLIVAQAPEILFLEDTNGDDVADTRTVLSTGWNTEDTHSGPSNLRMGLDNWIWGVVGYSGFDGVVNGKQLSFRMGVFRFPPDGSDLEFVASTTNNTWGLGLSETGEVFVSTANGDHHDFLAIPNRYIEQVRGFAGKGIAPIFDHKHIHPVTANVRQVDWHGQFTAAAGCALYTARAYPERYWNRVAFITEPTGHLVHECILASHGSGFQAHDGYNLFASTDEWTAPVAAEVGPDGHVWISDWYNYIVQHNPTPAGFENGPGNAYVTPLRDKAHGRVYRLVHTPGDHTPMPNLHHASNEALLEALGHSNLFWRMTAQRLLIARADRALLPALEALTRDTTRDAIGNAPGALHALATLDGLQHFAQGNKSGQQILRDALQHPAPALRRRAAQIAAHLPGHTEVLLPLVADEDPAVRLQALLALSEQAQDDSAGKAIAALLREEAALHDPWLPGAITIAGATHATGFLLEAAHTRPTAAHTILTAVANHYARGEQHPQLAEILSRYADAPPETTRAVLAGLAAGWPDKRPPDSTPALKAAIDRLCTQADSDTFLAAMKLARQWQLDADFDTRIQALVKDSTSTLARAGESDTDRILAAQRLLTFDTSRAARERVLDSITIAASLQLTAGLFDVLRDAGGAATGPRVLARFEDYTPRVREQAIDLLLARPAWTHALLDGIAAGEMPVPTLSIVQKRALLDSPDEALRNKAQAVLAQRHGTSDASREEIVQRLLPLAHQEGDATLGQTVFAENCKACHSFDGEGGTIAPDLTGIAGGNREEILIAILDPNRSVEGNFRQWHAETEDGLFYSGLLAQENQTSFGIYDARGELHTILREEVTRLTQSELSVMPEGFEQLPPEQLVGLLAYLTTTHNFFPMNLSAVANAVSTEAMFTAARNSDPYFERMIFDTWGLNSFEGVPYHIADPGTDLQPNTILLKSPHSPVVQQMPDSVALPCRRAATAIHLLSGVSGWGFPLGKKGTISMVVRLQYANGDVEDHPLRNGEHFADYIRVVEVPDSKLAFKLGPHQLRQLTIVPQQQEVIDEIVFLNGEDGSAPLVMAVTLALRKTPPGHNSEHPK